jgi:hypothetical protein
MDEQSRVKSLKKFRDHRAMAKRRGIDFNLTHEQWWGIWEQSGKWEQRGIKKGQYVMSRKNDVGPYELGNVYIQTQDQNMSESRLGKKQTESHIEKVRQASIRSWQIRKQEKELVNG